MKIPIIHLKFIPNSTQQKSKYTYIPKVNSRSNDLICLLYSNNKDDEITTNFVLVFSLKPLITLNSLVVVSKHFWKKSKVDTKAYSVDVASLSLLLN